MRRHLLPGGWQMFGFVAQRGQAFEKQERRSAVPERNAITVALADNLPLWMLEKSCMVEHSPGNA